MSLNTVSQFNSLFHLLLNLVFQSKYNVSKFNRYKILNIMVLHNYGVNDDSDAYCCDRHMYILMYVRMFHHYHTSLMCVCIYIRTYIGTCMKL